MTPEFNARELSGLFEAVYDRYGLDFRGYAHSSLRRRVMRHMQKLDLASLGDLRSLVLSDSGAMEVFYTGITVHVSAMFRDPAFFRAFREQIVPVLRTYPYLRFWVAGCSTGEEVYSLAILLHEENLISRCRIYATDINGAVLEQARSGIYPVSAMRDYTLNYQHGGGLAAFGEYYTAGTDYVVFRAFLRENVIFASHNLVSDASFNEFHGVLCRNVMIYFDHALQKRVHGLLYNSLLTFGYLGLGRSETIRFTPHGNAYEEVAGGERLYRKVK